ncbi:hypothetical protein [Algibacter mikhailovii]|uniref:hypothetical protein n=1 Tax=Algibacter mikhailovii TaxID=425498 RepID=UPI0024942B78|nr:hypothetical protein [Algibacter mikhailovii]
MKLKLQNRNTALIFLLAFIIFEVLIYFFLELLGYSGFTAIPFARLGIIVFTFFFLIKHILLLKIPIRLNTKASIHSVFFGAWFVFTIIELFIGVVNKNPVLYIITDFIYIFFGLLLFLTFKQKRIKQLISIEEKTFLKYSYYIAAIGYVLFFLGIKMPATLLIILVILTYIYVLDKKYFRVLILFTPYILEISRSNRTHLIVFLMMIFILFLRKVRERFNVIDLAFVFILTLGSIIFFLQDILNFIFVFVDANTNLGFRINQLIRVLENGIDYSNPYFTSISQRVLEIQAVINYWTSDLYSFIFGSGLGGVLDGSEFTDTSVTNSALLGKEKIHNIHVLPFAFIFRYGLFGITLLCLLAMSFYNSFVVILNNSKNKELIFWNLFFLLWIVFSLPAASFIWTSPIFWMSCAYIGNLKQTRNTSQ